MYRSPILSFSFTIDNFLFLTSTLIHSLRYEEVKSGTQKLPLSLTHNSNTLTTTLNIEGYTWCAKWWKICMEKPNMWIHKEEMFGEWGRSEILDLITNTKNSIFSLHAVCHDAVVVFSPFITYYNESLSTSQSAFSCLSLSHISLFFYAS